MKKYIIALCFLCGASLQAQTNISKFFVPPFDFPLYLSGNFGELRSNHFHGGIDFKTESVEGKSIHCIADGYISRISVSTGGYGNALYVTHTNGYTSVYGHLKEFAKPIADLVEKYQYEHETFVVDLTPDSLMFPCRQGQIIALSGNTGFSFGPHLHMEIRKTSTEENIDPLQFYMDKVKDTTPPRARAVVVYPQAGRGIVNGRTTQETINISTPKGKHNLAKPVEAWGEMGVGIKAYDYMDGTDNVYGVQSVTLYVDSAEVFNSTIDKYAYSENRMINSWTDFTAWKLKGSWVMKSFIAPGNTLRALRANKNRGVVSINQERDYKFLYVLKDLYGNASCYRFVVRGRKQTIPSYYPNDKHLLAWNRANVVQEPGMELIIPKGVLYEDVALNCKVRNDSNAIAFDYQLHDAPLPLHASCNLMIGVRRLPLKDTSKYYVARKQGKNISSVGGTYQNGWMKANINEMGTYTVAIDTIPPKVTPVSRSSWGRGLVMLAIKDAQTGIKSFGGTIDGKFALFGFSAKNAVLSCALNPRHVRKGGKHSLVVKVEDYCGNITQIEDTFVW